MSWTADALRIGEVLVDDAFKRFQQFLFEAIARSGAQRWEAAPVAIVPLGESHDWRPVSMKIFITIRTALSVAVLVECADCQRRARLSPVPLVESEAR